MRGRKPFPAQLKLVKGTARGALKRRGKPAVEAPPAYPAPPSHLSDEAKAEWARVAPTLAAMRMLSELDVGPLAAYCQAWATFKNAGEALERLAAHDPGTKGLLVKTTNGNAIQNPLIGIRNRAANDMVRFGAEFGLTPSARSRVNSLGSESSDDRIDEFFK